MEFRCVVYEEPPRCGGCNRTVNAPKVSNILDGELTGKGNLPKWFRDYLVQFIKDGKVFEVRGKV